MYSVSIIKKGMAITNNINLLDKIYFMKNMSFYLIMNKLYIMGLNKYINYIKEEILNTKWFKNACKEKLVTIKYLSKNYFKNIFSNSFFKYEDSRCYFYKLLLLKFEYKKDLEKNHHIKLLNINIVNETRFRVVELLISSQKNFLDTNYFFNMKIIVRKDFIEKYINTYDRYLDSSILSRILNYTYFMHNKYINKLDYLMPKKRFIFSIYIRDIMNIDLKSKITDEQISKQLYEKYKIKLSRRVVCDIRKQYLSLKIINIDDLNKTLMILNSFSNKKVLNKKNISQLDNNIQGVYELSFKKLENYPYYSNAVIYIGSSQNIKKRLNTYLVNAHTKEIKEFIQKHEDEVSFRFLKSLEYRDFEKMILNHFIYLHGKLPKLNTQRVY